MTNPFYYAKLWHGGGNKITGEIIPLVDYQELLAMGYKLWSFTGRTATIAIVTNDYFVTRTEALDFAIMFMKGTYATISVDLKPLATKVTFGS
jgi:hypothetical protein